MRVESLFDAIGSDFYTGVPDSQLKALCDYLMDVYGIDSRHHVIAANEGNCVALASGYHLATGKVPVVYLQNSGEGNVVNPVASLLNDKVCAIPEIFIIGWRGEPDVQDEPQHVYQGTITMQLLKDLDIEAFVIERTTSAAEVREVMDRYRKVLARGKSVSFVVRKGALSYEKRVGYENENKVRREDAIRHIVRTSGKNPIISTTGKASRELFEIREANGEGHERDFLTVGSMGHCSSIALGVALNKPETKVWCIDGDGAALMHMGAMAVIGASRPGNLIHVLINNGAHESVGGMPTVANQIDFVAIAKACGYPNAVSVDTLDVLDEELESSSKREGLSFIEVKCSIGARDDLGRPTTTAAENKKRFMDHLNEVS